MRRGGKGNPAPSTYRTQPTHQCQVRHVGYARECLASTNIIVPMASLVQHLAPPQKGIVAQGSDARDTFVSPALATQMGRSSTPYGLLTSRTANSTNGLSVLPMKARIAACKRCEQDRTADGTYWKTDGCPRTETVELAISSERRRLVGFEK